MNLLLFKIWSKVKSYLIYILGVVALCCICFCRCNTLLPKNVITVPKLVSQKVLAKIQKEVPTAIKAETFVPEKANLGEKITDTIVTKKDNSIVVIQTESIDWGFKNRLGGFIDGSLVGMGGGVRYNYFSWYKTNLDLNIGYPRASAGVSWQVLQNSCIGISYGFNYNKFVTEPAIYISLGF